MRLATRAGENHEEIANTGFHKENVNIYRKYARLNVSPQGMEAFITIGTLLLESHASGCVAGLARCRFSAAGVHNDMPFSVHLGYLIRRSCEFNEPIMIELLFAIGSGIWNPCHIVSLRDCLARKSVRNPV